MAATVVIRATANTLPGASMRVAGLTVVERAIRQWARVRDANVVVLSDGSVPLPRALPANVTVREGDAPGEGDILPANQVDPAGTPRTGGAPILVTDEASRRRAEDAVFADLLRGDLGLVARWVNKPQSLWLTRHLLCRLPVTPNQVTLGAALLALCGCALIATGGYAAVVAGFLLAQIQSVLDGCDGELARVRFQQSALGEWLDSIVDDGLNLSLVGAVGLAMRTPARAGFVGGGGPWLAVATAAMFLFYNVVCYRELIRQGEGGSVLKVKWWFARGRDMTALAGRGRPGLAAFLYNLGRRDVFVFAWLLLAVADRLDVVLLFALVVAGTSFVVALGQLVRR